MKNTIGFDGAGAPGSDKLNGVERVTVETFTPFADSGLTVVHVYNTAVGDLIGSHTVRTRQSTKLRNQILERLSEQYTEVTTR